MSSEQGLRSEQVDELRLQLRVLEQQFSGREIPEGIQTVMHAVRSQLKCADSVLKQSGEGGNDDLASAA